jgi:nucleoid DNA-binding protein
MAEDAKISKVAARALFKSLLKHVTEALTKGDKVTLAGLGTFKVVRRKARRGRNPQTGEALDIQARNAVKFVAAKKLPNAIAAEPESMELEPSPEADPVFLGASAPRCVKPGEEFTARFAAYTKDMEHEVRRVLQDLSPRSRTYLGVKKCRWKKGIRVSVVLSGRYLKIDDAAQEIEWNGRFNLLEYDVVVDAGAPEETVVLKYDVYFDEIKLAKLRVDLKISNTGKPEQPITKQAEPAQSAFASYSSQDRARVLDRVAAVRTSAGLDVFMDCLDLHPGEKWKNRLEGEILKRDLFLLFWSKYAVQSKWVEWEWTTAYELKGTDFFQLHPLDPVFDAPPPEKLAELHFSDPLMDIRKVYQKPQDI